jgi:phytoene dehydrogenase-like protein
MSNRIEASSGAWDFVIVGSGINSLVCAALLGRAGRRVLVLERNDRAGGCIRTDQVTLPGFVHDVLSCWHPLFITSPAYAELHQDLQRFGLEYCNTDTPTAIVRDDGSHFVFQRSRPANVRAMNALLAGEGDRWAAGMVEFERTLELTFTILGAELWSVSTLRTILKTWRRHGLQSFLEFGASGLETARTWLEDNFRTELVRACIAPWVLHAGQGVEYAGSGQIARVIPFTLETAGAPVVKGGGERLVQAFEQLIRSQGGQVIANADVDRVVVRNGIARGVVTVDGREYAAREAVICNVTPGQLYTRLLEEGHVSSAILHQAQHFRHGRSAMQIHVALREPPRWLHPELNAAALVHLADGIDSVSRAVNEAERGLLPASGTIVVGQPAALDPSRVPEGRGMLWIQILELPRTLKGDAADVIRCPADGLWNDATKEAYANRVMGRLARYIPGLERAVLARRVLSPADLESLNINLVGGDPYGGACTLDQLLLWRPLRGTRKHRTPVRQLYHIGASTHPGAGLGGGSGYLLAKQLI